MADSSHLPIPLPLPSPILLRGTAKSLPKVDQASALIADQTVALPEELVAGLIHRQTKVMLASGSKVGKTWIALYMAACISAGIPFLKWRTNICRVLYINLEILGAFFKFRLQTVREKLGLPNLDNVDVWNLRGNGLDSDALLEEITELTERKGYGLIVLDPIYKLMVGRSENTASGVGLLCHKLDQVVDKSGAAVF